MHVGLDLIMLRAPYTGIPNYVLHLLDAVLQAGLENEVRLSGFRGLKWSAVDRPLIDACLRQANKVHDANPGASSLGDSRPGAATPLTVLRNLRRTVTRVPRVHAVLSSLRAAHFSRTARRQKLDLFHALLSRPPSMSLAVPVLPAIYDLSFLKFPETHTKSRIRWMRPVAEMCEKAPVVHTISNFVADEICAEFGRDRSAIRVIEPGINDHFLVDARPDTSVLERLELRPFAFALSVATLEPRKNLKTLVQAFSSLDKQTRLRMPLVLVGGRGWGDTQMDRTADRLQSEGSLRMTGYVDDTDLRTLYSQARALFYPSLYEGFGMPITEALALGCPVCVSNAASMPEAASGAGRLVDPMDVSGWRDELQRSWDSDDATDPDQRQARRHSVTRFRWRNAAQKLLALYDELNPRL